MVARARKDSPDTAAPRRGAGVRSNFFGGSSIDAVELILSPTFAKRLGQVASLGFGTAARRGESKPKR